jgi:hypothetical protein
MEWQLKNDGPAPLISASDASQLAHFPTTEAKQRFKFLHRSAPEGWVGLCEGSDGKHVGTVLGVEAGQVKITLGGMDHSIDIEAVEVVEGESVTLKKTAEETVRTWH